MSSSILSSPFLNLTVLDQLLRDNSQPPQERVKLLSARLSLLANREPRPNTRGPSSAESEKQRREAIADELETRLRLGLAYLDITPPQLRVAEGELSVVESRCKGLLKRRSRPAPIEQSEETLTVTTEGSTPGQDRGIDEDEDWLARIRKFRIDALEGLIRVEDGLGRSARAERWKEVLKQLNSDAAGS